MVDARIAERRRALSAQRRRKRLRRSLVIALMCLPVVAVAILDASGRLAVLSISVEGAHSVADEQIIATAGISSGTSIVWLSTSDAAGRVAGLPRIDVAEVRRTLSRDVVISVEERVPVLRVSGPGPARQRDVLIDREGVVFAAIDSDGQHLALIRLSSVPPRPGATVEVHAALANAFHVWRMLSGPLRAEVTTYVAPGADRLVLELRRGVSIDFGRAERVDEKIRAIGAVLADLGDREIAVVDVRAPSRPVVMVDSSDDSDEEGLSGEADDGAQTGP